jgi:hypothetical protein
MRLAIQQVFCDKGWMFVVIVAVVFVSEGWSLNTLIPVLIFSAYWAVEIARRYQENR